MGCGRSCANHDGWVAAGHAWALAQAAVQHCSASHRGHRHEGVQTLQQPCGARRIAADSHTHTLHLMDALAQQRCAADLRISEAAAGTGPLSPFACRVPDCLRWYRASTSSRNLGDSCPSAAGEGQLSRGWYGGVECRGAPGPSRPAPFATGPLCLPQGHYTYHWATLLTTGPLRLPQGHYIYHWATLFTTGPLLLPQGHYTYHRATTFTTGPLCLPQGPSFGHRMVEAVVQAGVVCGPRNMSGWVRPVCTDLAFLRVASSALAPIFWKVSWQRLLFHLLDSELAAPTGPSLAGELAAPSVPSSGQ